MAEAKKIEINIPIFERNLKLHNKKGLRRSYFSVVNRGTEYMNIPPLGATTQLVLEASLDKEFAPKFQELLSSRGFAIIGSENVYYYDKMLQDYEARKNQFSNYADQMETIRENLKNQAQNFQLYKELENDDCSFYFLPKNEGISSLYEFIKTQKNSILAFAKEHDITIMLKVFGFSNQIEGFFGFNFLDADEKKKEVQVDFASNITIQADCPSTPYMYSACLLLTGVGETQEELADSDLNVHLVVTNLKYTKA